MKNLRRMSGFTLVEVTLALFVGGLLMSSVYFTMISGQRSSAGVERKVAAQQDVRAALNIMALEIGMGSYNPNFMLPGQIWVNPTTCTGVASNPLYKGIQVATPLAITVEMDVVENGTIADANEIISYAYDATSHTITRTVNCGTAEPFLGGGTGAAAGTKTVNLINTDASAPINNGNGVPAIFRYYNSNGTELYPGTSPADIPNIRRIDITLAAQTEEPDPSTNSHRKMIYSTSVLVRNHAIN